MQQEETSYAGSTRAQTKQRELQEESETVYDGESTVPAEESVIAYDGELTVPAEESERQYNGESTVPAEES